MRFLLTGATGFLGGELGRALIRHGHEVVAVVRAKRSAPKLPFASETVEWGALNVPALGRINGLIHLAGENIAAKRWSDERKRALRDSRIKTAREVVAALKKRTAPIELVITASASGIYGDRGTEVLDESAKPSSDFIGELCQDWENATKDAFPSARWLALRTTLVLAKNQGYLAKVEPMFRRWGASRLGSGDQLVSWIHLRDWLDLVLELVQNNSISGPINMAAPESVTNFEWTVHLQAALATFRGLPVPPFALKIAFGELASLLLASQRVVPERATNAGFEFTFPTVSSALSDIYSNGSDR